MQKCSIFTIILFFLTLSSSYACIWDSDTINDELTTVSILKGNIFYLITGQFPHHGQVYYQSRVKKSLELLTKTPNDTTVLNDLAVAYLKLGKYQDALAQFAKIESLKPGGVLNIWGAG